MPFILLVLVALVAGTMMALAVWRFPAARFAPAQPSATAARAFGEMVARHTGLRRFVVDRLNPDVATGLALTLALVLIALGGVALAVLAYLVRASDRLVELDRSVAEWGFDHATARSTDGIELITTLGETWLVIVGAVVLVVLEWLRKRPVRWAALFLACVMLGQNVIMHTIKDLADRVRPDFNPIAETLGPSFPSGHSSTAAAFWAAAALVLARLQPRRIRALLAGGAVAIAVAVAGSRVLLGVHWLSDVIAGLALGWAWFGVCSIAFGGRLLSFGAGVRRAQQAAVNEVRAES